MATFRTIYLTIFLTVAIMIFGLFKLGFLTTAADVTTHDYQVYCDGMMVDNYTTSTFNGVDVCVDINQNYHFGR